VSNRRRGFQKSAKAIRDALSSEITFKMFRSSAGVMTLTDECRINLHSVMT